MTTTYGDDGDALTEETPEVNDGSAALNPVSLACFEELGLNGYQARVLVALLSLGSAGAAHLAQIAGVPRTSVYPVLNDLNARGVAEMVIGGDKSPSWTCPPREEVLERLVEAQETRLEQQRIELRQARDTLVGVLPRRATPPLADVLVVRGAAGTRGWYDRLLSEATESIDVFTRPPFTGTKVIPGVLKAVARGLRLRALYPRPVVEDAEFARLRQTLEVYHDAGVDARVVEDLPIKLVIADRTRAFVGMLNNEAPDQFPNFMLIEHPAYARYHAESFDLLWESATPYRSK